MSDSAVSEGPSATCSLCRELKAVAADCDAYSLPFSGESVALKTAEWRGCLPNAHEFRLLSESERGEDGSLPLCADCARLVTEVDELESKLSDKLETLWGYLKVTEDAGEGQVDEPVETPEEDALEDLNRNKSPPSVKKYRLRGAEISRDKEPRLSNGVSPPVARRGPGRPPKYPKSAPAAGEKSGETATPPSGGRSSRRDKEMPAVGVPVTRKRKLRASKGGDEPEDPLEDDDDDDDDDGEGGSTAAGEGRDVRKSLKCQFCPEKFRFHEPLHSHMAQVHNFKAESRRGEIKCPECDKTLLTRHGFRAHMLNAHGVLSREGARVYECAECGRKFYEKQCYDDHRNVHDGLAPYECPVCGVCKAGLAALRTHVHVAHKRRIRRVSDGGAGGKMRVELLK